MYESEVIVDTLRRENCEMKSRSLDPVVSTLGTHRQSVTSNSEMINSYAVPTKSSLNGMVLTQWATRAIRITVTNISKCRTIKSQYVYIDFV